METKSYKTHYGAHWMALALLAAIPLLYQRTHSHQAFPHFSPPPVAATNETVDWFFMLRMPAITTQYESGITVMQVRYGLWLDALTQQGFHPMKLSDVIARIQEGKGVPEKTVVILFDPGFRRTYPLVAPILQSRHWPAVWISNEPAMEKGHREYVTYHAARQMVNSGLWDVGFQQKDGTIVVNSSDHGSLHLGDAHHPAWSAVTGGVALNRGSSLAALNRLNIISDWTEQDMLNRVRVELPVRRRVFLTKAPVQNLTWGVTTEHEDDSTTRFDLQVAPHKRGLVLDWFGTKDIPDSAVHGEATALIGDFTMRLRWDEEKGNGISVLVSKNQLFVEELQGYHVKSTYRSERADASGQFRIDLEVRGKTLLIGLDGHAPVQMALKTEAEKGRGLFQLFLVDRFRGTARAQAVRLTFTPLPHPYEKPPA